MMGLHDRFLSWLLGRARGELPRDAALHASACEDCQQRAIAYDALLAIDPGASPLPVVPGIVDARRGLIPLEIPQQAIVLTAVVLLAVAVGIGTGGLLGGRTDVGNAPVASHRGEGIQAGGGGPSAPSDAPSVISRASPSLEPSPSSSEDATASPGTGTGSPLPPGPVAPPAGTPAPTTGAQPAPTTRPTPTNPVATASATPTATQTPAPSTEPTQPPASEEPSPSEAPSPP
jgi:hypothetical protein